MFSGLNKVVDRNFTVGFAIPALLFLYCATGLCRVFGLVLPYLDLKGDEPLKDTTVLALVSLAGAFVLMIFNWNILRIVEGYWYWDFGRNVNSYFKQRWKSLDQKIAGLNAEWKDNGYSDSFPNMSRLARAREEFAERFPSEQTAVLPTKFGNALHAFEDYPRKIYGLDSIPGWIRLNAVIPKEYRELIDEARGDMNFWMNLWFLSWCLLAEYVGLAVWFRRLPLIWFVVPALICSIFFCSEQATKAGVAWGHWVKGSFDMFILDLLKKLGYKAPVNLGEIREICEHLSQTMIYRVGEPLEEIEKFRECDETPRRQVLPEKETSLPSASQRLAGAPIATETLG
ncbi:MAG: hypothetical protein ACLP7Q_02925 [Isosphaeraceae bacterium]